MDLTRMRLNFVLTEGWEINVKVPVTVNRTRPMTWQVLGTGWIGLNVDNNTYKPD